MNRKQSPLELFERGLPGERLALVMDQIESALYFDPGVAGAWVAELWDLLRLWSGEVSERKRRAFEIRARGLEATADSLTGRSTVAIESMEKVVEDAAQLARKRGALTIDIHGWLWAKLGGMFARDQRWSSVITAVRAGEAVLENRKSLEVRAVRAQLLLLRASVLLWRDGRAEEAASLCEEAYRLSDHRDQKAGGYYERGDITKTTALVNLAICVGDSPEARRHLLQARGINVRHNLRGDWGFAPYHEVFIARCYAQALRGDEAWSDAIKHYDFACRGFLALGMLVLALESALRLIELQEILEAQLSWYSDYRPTVARVVEAIQFSPDVDEQLREAVADSDRLQCCRERVVATLQASPVEMPIPRECFGGA